MSQTPEFAVAMDWGGTWARASVADRNGVLLWSDRVRNAPGAGKDRLIEDAERLLHQAIGQCMNTQWLELVPSSRVSSTQRLTI